jgi:C-terminal processing protease CtpA/Prc
VGIYKQSSITLLARFNPNYLQTPTTEALDTIFIILLYNLDQIRRYTMKKSIVAFIIIFITTNLIYSQQATHTSVTKLYVATFNRAPDGDGLNYWVGSKLDLEDIAMSFFDQDETRELYPDGYSSQEFIKSIYSNLFNRKPDNNGLQYWVEALDKGNISKSLFILAVVNGAVGDDATILNNKTTVGLRFVESGSNDIDIAKKVMQDITSNPKSVEIAQNNIFEWVNIGECNSIADQNRYIYKIMNDKYLWYSYLPTLDYNLYSDTDKFLEELKYKKYDRWSFIIDAKASDQYYKDGKYLGYGYRPRFYGDRVYIQYVHKNSSAYRAGLYRGDEILEIAGKSLKEIDDNNLWDTIFGDEKVGVEGRLKIISDGIVKDVLLTKELIEIQTILANNIFTIGDKKIGYLMFNSFIEPSKNELSELFRRFKSEKIDELIVDLRYNGGGQLGVSRYLSSLIAGSKASGQVFETLVYNDKHHDMDRSYKFENYNDSLNIDRVYFITTYSTASASESVINSLTPFLEVYTIGGATHGKPVGMIGHRFCDKYLYPVMFQGFNANNFGDYFGGIEASCIADDDITHQLGDIDENMLKSTIYLISNGNSSCYHNSRKRKIDKKTKEILSGFKLEVGSI